MIKEITTKVLHSERDISVKEKNEETDDQIRVISTFKADDKMVSTVKKCEESFKATPSFRGVRGKLFSYVKKVGPSIRSKINNVKTQALGTKKGGVEKCHGRGCKCCRMLNRSSCTVVNKKKIKLAKGTCKTYNVTYLAVCDICHKPYTGRTVQPIHKRVDGHRHVYKEILKASLSNNLDSVDTSSDLYALGLHLHLEHGLCDPQDFDKHLKFSILEVVNPSDLEVKEFKWMHKLNCFQPIGINVEYPFGLPYLEEK